MVKCAGTQRDGRQCGAPPMRGEEYCLFHTPEHAEDAKEARRFGGLRRRSLIGRPDAANPFIALPSQVEKAVYDSMRGERSGFIKDVTREAVGDTVYLIRLVIALNVHIEEVLRLERLRHASLYWWSRALEAEGKRGKAPRAELRRGVATLRGSLHGTERARASAEARYLNGHACLFPELAAGWQDLSAAAELLGDVLDDRAIAGAEQDVQRVVRMARTDGLDAAGHVRAADAMADGIARTSVIGGTDG